ncbi:hypothetical protein [Mycolicibacterium setense]|uniref:hypothetical protein n=1 Tax=Mycolicibacterium setense TaxID=431269 RepID=UPI000A5CED26|nr:hypothetical protein [Mycolicibacterium setense]
MSLLTPLVDGAVYDQIDLVVAATVGALAAALPSIAFVHRVLARRRDRREAADREERDAEQRARDRLHRMIQEAATAPTFTALKSIQDKTARLREENPPWNLDVELLVRACAVRGIALCADQISASLSELAPSIVGIAPLAATPGGVLLAERLNGFGRQHIDECQLAVHRMRHGARMFDSAAFAAPHQLGPDTHR